MSKCLDKLPHSCGTRRGLQVFEQDRGGMVDGFCFSCGTYVPNPYGEPRKAADLPRNVQYEKAEEEIQQELEEIGALKAIDLKVRRLRAPVLEEYGIKVGYSEEDGKTPSLVFFPYTKNGKIVRYKVKVLATGKIWAIGNEKDVDLFGWEQAKASGARRLIITEGEFDAPALLTIMRTHTPEQFANTIPAIVSLRNGASGAVKDLTKALPEIRKYFKEISLCFDMDEPGQKAVAEVCKIVPEATVISLPAKDANDCIIEGKGKAAHKAVAFHTEKPKNTSLVWGRDVHEKAKEKPAWGWSWPWKGMTDKTRGIRTGETIYIAAGEKMGKSEIVNALAKHLAIEHGLKIMLAKPEEANVKTWKLLVSKVVGKVFHDPKVEFDEKAFDAGAEGLKDSVCMLNLYQNITWDRLRLDIREAASLGVKAVFIDPITNLTNGMKSTEINEHLQGVAQELAVLAKDLDIVIFIFCHLNKPPKGSTPWDRGGKITTDFLAGSSAMARSCHYVIGLEGNKDPDIDEHLQHMRDLVILADREFGETGRIKLFWDKETHLFNEV